MSLYTEKCKLTPEGGFAVLLTTASTGTFLKGNLMHINATGQIALATTGDPDPVGILYEDSGNSVSAWVVISGIADVRFSKTTVIGQVARGFVSGDTQYIAGCAMTQDVAGITQTQHNYEIGHCLEAVTISDGQTALAKCVVHFN